MKIEINKLNSSSFIKFDLFPKKYYVRRRNVFIRKVHALTHTLCLTNDWCFQADLRMECENCLLGVNLTCFDI